MRKESTLDGIINWLVPGLIFLFLLVDPLLLSPEYYGPLTLIIFLVAIVQEIRSSNRILDSGFPLLVIAVVFLSASRSGFAWNGLEYALVFTGAVVLCIQVNRRSEQDLEKFLGWSLLIFLLVHLGTIGFEYISQINTLGWYGIYHFPSGSFLNLNVLARVLGLVGFYFLSVKEPPWNSPVNIFLVLVLFACMCWTGSRGAMLAGVGALLTFVYVRWSLNRTIWFVGVVLAVIAIGLLIGNIQHVTNSQRLALAGESWEIFERSPLTGVGGWNFGLVYPQVSFDDHWQRHPHTFPLWVLTGFGGLGFGVVVAGGYLLYQRRLRPRYLPLIVFFTLHELVDTMLWIPAILYLLAILLPLIVSGSKEGERSRHEKVGLFPEFSVPKIVRASLLYFLTIVSGFVMWNTITFKNGIKLANAQQWEQAESRLSQSTVAFSLVHRALAQTRLDQPNKAVSLLKRARRLNQYDPYYAYLLSKLLSDLGHAGEAKRYESLRRRLDPNDVLSIADPPSEWGATFYPSEYGRVGSATLRPERVKMHPRRAGWYLPLVDERIRQSDCKTALDRIKRLEKFPEVTHFTRIQLESRRLNCYRMKGWTSRIKRSRERLKRLRNREPSVRSMYHQFFYRRTGLDHGFFKH